MDKDRRADLINRFHETLLSAPSTGEVPHYRLCGWSSAASQRARFDALLSSSRFQGGSVVDYGCGTGDLYESLSRSGHKFTYTGLDQSAHMVMRARQTYGDHFAVVGLDEVRFAEADYVFASGIFQFYDVQQPTYHEPLLRALFERCKIGLAANFLSALRPDSEKDPKELYMSPGDIATLASSLSGKWVLDHSYHAGNGDMTVGIIQDHTVTSWKRPQFP